MALKSKSHISSSQSHYPLVTDLTQYINNKMGRPDQAPLYIYVDNEIVVSPENTMAELYQEHREDDFFLYLAYYEENIHTYRSKSFLSDNLTT